MLAYMPYALIAAFCAAPIAIIGVALHILSERLAARSSASRVRLSAIAGDHLPGHVRDTANGFIYRSDDTGTLRRVY